MTTCQVSRKLPLFIAVAACAVAPLSFAQSAANAAAAGPAFEVASIRQNMNPNPRWHLRLTPDGVDAEDVTLQYVIREAYRVHDDRLWSGGPVWLNQRRFDIRAKFDLSEYPHPSLEERLAMLRQLLADRFKLVVHHETKEFPLYELVVAKRGPKIDESKPQEIEHTGLDGRALCLRVRPSKPGGAAFQGCSMKDLASMLTQIPAVGRAVVDNTGLTARYTFELYWRRSENPSTSISSASVPSASISIAPDMSLPSIFTALKEQLGLELKPTKGPLDTIVIDHVEMPTPN